MFFEKRIYLSSGLGTQLLDTVAQAAAHCRMLQVLRHKPELGTILRQVSAEFRDAVYTYVTELGALAGSPALQGLGVMVDTSDTDSDEDADADAESNADEDTDADDADD